MFSIKKRNEGFTIVELLIVIVVIAILALLVITTYSGIQAKARNSKRQTDLASIQTHLEAFYNDNGYYPALGDLNQTAAGAGTFIKDSMNGLDPEALVDPKNPTKSQLLLAAPDTTKHQYAYAVTDSSNASCEADHTTCAKYTLTAQYEGSVNGSTTYTKNSLN